MDELRRGATKDRYVGLRLLDRVGWPRVTAPLPPFDCATDSSVGRERYAQALREWIP